MQLQVGQKTCAQLCSSITLFAQALILAPRLFASSPNWAASPPWLWNCQVAFRKTTVGGDFERCSQILLPNPWISRLNQDGGGGGEMIQRCGEKVKKQAVERTIHPLEVDHSLFPIPDPSSCHTVPTSRTWSCSCHRAPSLNLIPPPPPIPPPPHPSPLSYHQNHRNLTISVRLTSPAGGASPPAGCALLDETGCGLLLAQQRLVQQAVVRSLPATGCSHGCSSPSCHATPILSLMLQHWSSTLRICTILLVPSIRISSDRLCSKSLKALKMP